jgi:tetratricopeptide (TPR) repeat protein
MIVLVGLFIVGCATAPSAMNKVSVGMTKSEVVSALGQPQSTRATQGVEYLIYHCREVSIGRQYFMATQGISGEMEADYYVRLVNGRVDAYGKQGDFDSTHIPEQRLDLNVNMHGNTGAADWEAAQSQSAAPAQSQSVEPAQSQSSAFDLALQSGMAALKNQDWKSASVSLQQAATLDPSSQKAWASLGTAYGMMHDFPDALYAARRAVDINPNEPWALASLAAVYGVMGETNKYAETLEKVRRLDPATEEAIIEFVKEEKEKIQNSH